MRTKERKRKREREKGEGDENEKGKNQNEKRERKKEEEKKNKWEQGDHETQEQDLIRGSMCTYGHLRIGQGVMGVEDQHITVHSEANSDAGPEFSAIGRRSGRLQLAQLVGPRFQNRLATHGAISAGAEINGTGFQ